MLFGSTHIVFDISRLLESGEVFVCLAAVMQTIAGWILGIIYIKPEASGRAWRVTTSATGCRPLSWHFDTECFRRAVP